MTELTGVVVRHTECRERVIIHGECRELPDSDKMPCTEIDWWGSTEPQASRIPGTHGEIGEFVQVTVEVIPPPTDRE